MITISICEVLYTIYKAIFISIVFRFNSTIAPSKLGVISLMPKPELEAVTEDIIKVMRRANISCKSDDSGVAIGKKYARFDEVGIPYIVTVDYDTLKEQTVTLRERDSMEQVRIKVADAVRIVSDLVNGNIAFASLK